MIWASSDDTLPPTTTYDFSMNTTTDLTTGGLPASALPLHAIMYRALFKLDVYICKACGFTIQVWKPPWKKAAVCQVQRTSKGRSRLRPSRQTFFRR